MVFFKSLGNIISAPVRIVHNVVSGTASRLTGEKTERSRLRRAEEDYHLTVQGHKQLESQYSALEDKLKAVVANLKGLGEEKAAQEELLKEQAEPLAREHSALQSKAQGLLTQRDKLISQVENFSKQVQGTNLQGKLEQILKEFKGQFEVKEGELQKEKQALSGLDRDENPLLFSRFTQGVDDLGTQRVVAENKLKHTHGDLTKQHQGFAKKLESFKGEVTKLLQQKEVLAQEQEAYTELVAKTVSPMEEKLKDLTVRWQKEQTQAKEIEGNLKDYQGRLEASAQKVNSYGQAYEAQAKKYEGKATLNTMVTGALMGLGTGGAMSAWGGAAGANAGLIGTTVGLGTMSHELKGLAKKFGNLGSINQSMSQFQEGQTPDLRQVFASKVKMPEMVGIKQSLEHFKLPTLPSLSQLPKLDETLGSVKDYQQRLASLGILPNPKQKIKHSFLNPQNLLLLKGLLTPKLLHHNTAREARVYG